MNVKHEKSIILDIVKHRLYDDGKHDSSFLDMFELLVIAQFGGCFLRNKG